MTKEEARRILSPTNDPLTKKEILTLRIKQREHLCGGKTPADWRKSLRVIEAADVLLQR